MENNPHVILTFKNFEKCKKERFSKKISRTSLEKMLNSCVQENLESVGAYSTRLRCLGRQLVEAYGGTSAEVDLMSKLMEDRLVAQFLAGLRPDIARFVAVRSPRDLIEAEKFARLEQTAVNAQAPQTQTCFAVAARSPPSGERRWRRENANAARSVVCFTCGFQGHFARQCSNKNKNNKRACFNCGDSAHLAKNCPKIICGVCNEKGHLPVNCSKNSVSGN